MTAPKCSATRRDGSPCNAYALSGSDYCYHHDPRLAARRRQARRKGGRARHGRQVGPVGAAPNLPLATMSGVTDLLRHAINQALQLENSIARARTLGYLAGLLIKALDIASLEERVLLLERVLQSREDAP
jgi:hypothetical protein